MTDREELFYRFARALDHSREAAEFQQAADETHDTPGNAAKAHWDAADLIEGVITRLQTLHDVHVFDARRMDRAQREERRTGREYRRAGNGGAAA